MPGHDDAALLDEVYTTARELYDSYEQPHQTGVRPRCLCARCALVAAAEQLKLSPAQRREALYLLQVDAKAKYALTTADLAASGPETVGELYTSILMSLAHQPFAPEDDAAAGIGGGRDGLARRGVGDDGAASYRQPWPPERPAPLVANLPFVTAGGLALDQRSNRLYLPIDGGAALAVVDAANCTSFAIVPLGAPGENWEPTAVAVNPRTSRAYVLHSTYDRGTVTVVDTATNSAVTSTPLEAAPTDVAVNAVANRLYVAQHDAEQVAILDGESLRVLRVVPFNTTVGAIRFDPAANRVYAAEDRDGVIQVLDGAGERLARIDLGSPVFDLALDSAGARLYAAGGDLIGDALVEGCHTIDTAGLRRERRVRTSYTPMHIVAAGQGRIAIAPARYAGIAFMDPRADHLSVALHTPGAVVGLAADPGARRVYVLGLTSLRALETPGGA